MSELLSKLNGSTIKKEPIFYKGWFGKLYEVEIIVKEKWRYRDGFGDSYTYYKYVVKLKTNGKIKYVESDKLIMGDDD